MKTKTSRLVPKGISMGAPGKTKEWKGETVYMPEAFGIKFRKKARTLGG
jgi:hypothetical protein